MKLFYSIILGVFAFIIVLFALQNLQTTTVSLFNWKVTLPISLLVIGIYFLGMASGSALLAFIRGTWRRAKKPPINENK
jgi:putative membrane protein